MRPCGISGGDVAGQERLPPKGGRRQLPKPLIPYIGPTLRGHVAEWLRNGLQNRVHQFNSGRGLHHKPLIPSTIRFLLGSADAARGGSVEVPGGGVTGFAQGFVGTSNSGPLAWTSHGIFFPSAAPDWAPRDGQDRRKIDRRPSRICVGRTITRPRGAGGSVQRSSQASAGRVPSVGKRQQRPSAIIVVGGHRSCPGYRVKIPRAGRELLLWRRSEIFNHHGVPDGIQQQVEFGFASHRTLAERGWRNVAKLVCYPIEPIVRILTIRRSDFDWLAMSKEVAARSYVPPDHA